MKTKNIVSLFAATMLGVACTPDYSEHTFRGILYTDSTLQTVIPNADMTFMESSGAHGSFATDAQGRWGFSYIRYLDNPTQNNAKFQFEEYLIVLKYGDDTVFYELVPRYESTSDTIAIYPGYMEHLRNQWNNNNDSI